MSSLIEEQHVESRNRKSRPVARTLARVIPRSSQGLAGRAQAARSIAYGDSGVQSASSDAYMRSTSHTVIDFPAAGQRTKRPVTSPAEGMSVNGFDLIFLSNLILMLFVVSFLLLSPNRIALMNLSSESLFLPQGLVLSDPMAELAAAGADSSEDVPLEIDSNQFSALEVTEYTVQPGDTLGQIAIDHNLNLDTLVSFNQISDVRRMQVGEVYVIPNRDGLLHEVESGDSLSGLAEDYGSSLNAILDANSLASEAIAPGQAIFIPGARMNQTDLKLILGELFAYPTTGRFTSSFGYRSDPFTGARRFHNGLDLANVIGTPIRAAMGGTVVAVENQIGNYGKVVIIQHPRGFQTLYGHMSEILVRRGQYVSQGELIGRMGNTGRSTGSHLHFSVILNGNFVDPMSYLH